MKKLTKQMIPSIYHPTTIIFVDDDPNVIQNYALALTSQFSFKGFTSPDKALAYINASKLVGPIDYRSDFNAEDFNHFQHEIANPDRFKQHSILVTDYAMPGMNGVQLCEKISSRYLSKILITGVADEKIAMDAFNAGVIHQFIKKQDSNIITRIASVLEWMQKDFFLRLSDRVAETMQYFCPPFLDDARFTAFFEELVEREEICEYYLCHKPNGFLLIDNEGDMERLLVYTERDLSFIYNMAISQKAPEGLIKKLEPDKPVDEIPFFWKHRYGIYDAASEPWEKCFYPATKLAGEEPFYYARIKDKDAYQSLMVEHLSFYDYLENLRQSGGLIG